MDRNFVDGIVEDTASTKSAWIAPQVGETDIAAITAAGAGSANDGVTTAS